MLSRNISWKVFHLFIFLLSFFFLSASEEQDSLKLIDALNKGEELYNNLPDSAVKYYEIAVHLSNSLELQELKAKALCGLAKSFYIKADFNESLSNFDQALKIYESLNDTIGIIYGLNGCGIALTMLSKEEEAIINHKKSMVLCLEIEDNIQLAKNLFNIAVSYESLKDYDLSLTYVDSSLLYARQYESINNICKYSNHKAQLQILKGDFAKAVKTIETVLETEGFTDQWEIQYAKAGLGKAYMHLGMIEKSLDYSHQALIMAQSINSKWDLKELNETLSQTYELKGDYLNSLKYHKKYKAYNDSIFTQTRDREVNFHLLKEQKLENHNLITRNEVIEKQLKIRNILIISIIIIMLISIAAAVIYIRLYSIKSKLLSELAELNQTKDKLFRIIGHDLKTPISVMVQFTDLLQENLEEYDSETIQKFLVLLNRSSREGFDLLTNLLSWAQSQTGELPFEPKSIKIDELLITTWDLLESQAELKQIKLVNRIQKNITVKADKHLMQIILRNIISNAIKFSYPNNQVICTIEELDSGIKFCIRDFGIGINKEQRQNIFKPGNTFSIPGTNNEKGTGLGLAICNEFVEMHGGKIWIEDVTPGSKVCFSLPNI